MSVESKPAEHHIADAMRRVAKAAWRADEDSYIAGLLDQAKEDIERATKKIEQRMEEP